MTSPADEWKDSHATIIALKIALERCADRLLRLARSVPIGPPSLEEIEAHVTRYRAMASDAWVAIARGPTIHILHRGATLCGLYNLPADHENWPIGHRWVRLEDGSMATCRMCLDRTCPEPRQP